MTSFINLKSNLENSSEILSRIALADKAAAKECVDVYGGMIWSLTKKNTDSTEQAEKAIQEIFIDIWQNAQYCDLSISDERTWIVLIAQRRLSKYAVESKYQSQANVVCNALQYNSKKPKKQIQLAG